MIIIRIILIDFDIHIGSLGLIIIRKETQDYGECHSHLI